MLLPVTAFAVEERSAGGDARQEIAAAPRAAKVSSSISKVGSSSVKISATAFGSPSSNVTAVSQLQRYVNGSWTNYGTAVSSSGRGSATASKTVAITKGYSYRAKATSSVGAVSYSGTVTM